MKTSIFLFTISLLALTSFLIVNFALADATLQGQGTPPAGTVSLTNPLPTSDVPTFLGVIIKYSMGIIGSLALVMFIFGGATWMLSAGNQEKVAKGKQIIIWAALGIALIFTAYALVKFIITTLSGT